MKVNYLASIYFIFLVSITNIFPQISEDNYYQQGINSLKNSDTISAIIHFQKSIDENKNPYSSYQMALILKNSKKSDIILKAKYYFKDAIEKEPTNIEFKFQYGLYLEYLYKIERPDFLSLKQAINQYNEIIKINPNYSPAYYRLGFLKYNDFIDFNRSTKKYLKTPIVKYGEHSIAKRDELLLQQWQEQFDLAHSYDGESKLLFRDSEKYLLKAIDTDPHNYDAYKTLALLYEDAEENQKGLEIINSLIKREPYNYNLYLMAGIFSYKLNNNDDAYYFFQKAISLMPVEEKQDFISNTVKLLLSSLIEENKFTLNEEKLLTLINTYWIDKDPLLLTSYNERLLEHYFRVAYANIHFGVEWKNLKGWQSDRGEVLIRYGLPLKRVKIRQWTDTEEPPRKLKNVRPLQRANVETEVWIYDEFILAFIDPFQNGEFKFNIPETGPFFNSQFTEDTDLFVKQGLRISKPEIFIPKFKGPVFDQPYSIIQFRNTKNYSLTDIVVCCQLQVPDDIAIESEEKNKFIVGLFYYDKNFSEKYALRNIVNLGEEKSKIYSSIIETEPEVGNLALECIRNLDEGVSSYHGKYKVKDFSTNMLNISDLVLAYKIENDIKISGGITRNNLVMLPNPSNTFSRSEPVFIYYEIYNLELNKEKLTDFDQSIVIKRIGEETILNKILDVVGLGKNGEKITLKSNYKTLEKDPQIYFQLDMSNYESGEYEIEIQIIDNIAKRKTTTSKRIKWSN